MKRTLAQRRSKNTSSTVRGEKFPSENDSTVTTKIRTGETKNKLSFENLTSARLNSDGEKSKIARIKKFRTTVDLEMMKEELKQLEDPPVTKEEIETSSKKLPYSFYNVSCTVLAKKLLGKILVRRLENGTILKGRIVETEAYLGAIDKASQTYQGKVTPRNLPLYMSPGTIYVYLTYGMYHCFNISSQESDSYVLIRALEVLNDTDYVELLRNAKSNIVKGAKLIGEDVRKIETRELCNEPWKICSAFAIDPDNMSREKIWNSSLVWLEKDSTTSQFLIVDAPSRAKNVYDNNACCKNILRYYVLGEGCGVLLRGLEPILGIEEMKNHRISRLTARRETSRLSKTMTNHEISNGPSKLCIALEIDRKHCKYSICNCKFMWIENDEIFEYLKIVKTTRIGIDSAGTEWANKSLRYYVYGNTSVSKRDKKAEAECISCD